MKREKGITLIALIITIIVLLILAGVSIALVTGEEGILTKTQTAVEETNTAQGKEELALILTGMKMKAYKNDEEIIIDQNLADELKNNDKVTNAVYEDGKIKVTMGKDIFIVGDNLTIVEPSVLLSKLNVEIVDDACIKITSSNPNENSGKVTIKTMDNDVYELNLADSNAKVEYWAYKSQNYKFEVKDTQGNIEEINVDVEMPLTPAEYLDINGTYAPQVKIKNYASYYYYYQNSTQYGGTNLPVKIINVTNQSNTGCVYTLYSHMFYINGITTIILPEETSFLDHNAGNKPGQNLKTIYIPQGTDLDGEVFSGLTENTRIYFGDSEPASYWGNNWNYNCSAKMYWGR